MSVRPALAACLDAVCYLALWFGAVSAGFAVGLWLVSAIPVPATAAPVPPPPRLSAELLAGATWQFEWAELRDGWISFNRDGTYCATHAPDELDVLFVGAWRVEGDRVFLTESAFNPQTGDVGAPREKEFTLSAARFPTLAGETPEGGRVVLYDPQR